MGSLIREEYEKIIHVDDKPSFDNHILEGVIHEMLECGGGVVETKEHNGRFEQSFVCDEGCLPLMPILDADIVVSPSNVKLGEMFYVLEFINKIRNKKERVGILDGMFIQVTVVLIGTEFPILLFDKEERGGLGRVEGADLSRG